MVWALLAILGVPLWLVVGGLAAAMWNRRQFRNTPGVFRAKVRLTSGALDGLSESWPPVAAYARWVHDVLLVNKGLALVRTLPLPIAAAEGPVEEADPHEVKRLGDNPILMQLRLDNGATIQLAAPGEARAVAYGPFVSNFALEAPKAETIGQA
jgi:hypothetical protein